MARFDFTDIKVKKCTSFCCFGQDADPQRARALRPVTVKSGVASAQRSVASAQRRREHEFLVKLLYLLVEGSRYRSIVRMQDPLGELAATSSPLFSCLVDDNAGRSVNVSTDGEAQGITVLLISTSRMRCVGHLRFGFARCVPIHCFVVSSDERNIFLCSVFAVELRSSIHCQMFVLKILFVLDYFVVVKDDLLSARNAPRDHHRSSCGAVLL